MDADVKKLLRCSRIGVCLLALLLAVACAAAAILVPRALDTLDRIGVTLEGIDSLVETADAALVAANEAADSANKLVADNSEAVAEAMEKFNSVDFETLNKAINDLADIVEPLAKVSNFFNRG
ncbi:MAG: hypothetical protein J5449_13660 [Oscillospiraceae bacterium]|nr:hypothetical protein [Oscillospiraceae bacterium]